MSSRTRSETRSETRSRVSEAVKSGLMGGLASGVISGLLNYLVIPFPQNPLDNAVGHGISGLLCGFISAAAAILIHCSPSPFRAGTREPDGRAHLGPKERVEWRSTTR